MRIAILVLCVFFTAAAGLTNRAPQQQPHSASSHDICVPVDIPNTKLSTKACLGDQDDCLEDVRECEDGVQIVPYGRPKRIILAPRRVYEVQFLADPMADPLKIGDTCFKTLPGYPDLLTCSDNDGSRFDKAQVQYASSGSAYSGSGASGSAYSGSEVQYGSGYMYSGSGSSESGYSGSEVQYDSGYMYSGSGSSESGYSGSEVETSEDEPSCGFNVTYYSRPVQLQLSVCRIQNSLCVADASMLSCDRVAKVMSRFRNRRMQLDGHTFLFSNVGFGSQCYETTMPLCYKPTEPSIEAKEIDRECVYDWETGKLQCPGPELKATVQVDDTVKAYDSENCIFDYEKGQEVCFSHKMSQRGRDLTGIEGDLEDVLRSLQPKPEE